MRIKEIIDILENLAPPYLQESYDNSGLLIGNKNDDIDKAIISLDITEEVLNEAMQKKCKLIISHHPVIFSGLKSITGKNATERIVKEAIQNDIAIYAIHTNLDNVAKGINSIICDKIGLKNRKILAPKNDLLRKLVAFCPLDFVEKVRQAIFDAGAGNIGDYDNCSYSASGTGSFRGSDETNPFVGEKGKLHFEDEIRLETIYPVYHENAILKALINAHPYEEVAYDIYLLGNKFEQVGAGMVGELASDIDEVEFLKTIKQTFGTGCVRHSALLGKKIKKVAVCGGSGSFLIKNAISAQADIYITGDIKYHDFFEAEGKMVIADIGHFESEKFAKDLIYSVLKENFSNFAVLISETNTNSVNYI